MTQRAGWPVVICAVAFNADPNSTTVPTWTDISNRLREFSTKRGREYELVEVEAGTASIKARNDDGALDPTNTSSIYSPNVLPYRAARIQATWSGTTYNVFTGYVERWPQEWDSAQYGSSPLELVDGFALISARTLAAQYVEQVLSDGALSFYPLYDGSGSTTAAELVAKNNASELVYLPPGGPASAPVITFGSVTPTPTGVADVGTAATFANFDTGVTKFYAQTVLDVPTGAFPSQLASGKPYTLEFWFATTQASTGVDSAVVMFMQADGSNRTGIAINSGTLVHYLGGNAPGFAAGSVASGAWHHVAHVFDGGTESLYLDGSLVDGPNIISGTWNLSRGHIGGYGPKTANAPAGAQGFAGSLAGVAVYNTALTSTTISKHYNVGKSLFNAETPGARAARLVSYLPWRGTFNGVGAQTPTNEGSNTGTKGQSLLDAIKSVADDDGAVLSIGVDGAINYTRRYARMTTTTSAYTFGDGVGELPYVSCSFDFDPTYVYNNVQVSRTGGSQAVATDATSQAHYFPRVLSFSKNILSDTEIADAASWLLANYKDPHLRPKTLVIEPSSNTALWPAALSLDIGSRITVKRRPSGSTNTLAVDCFIEGVEHSATRDKWRTTFHLSPIPSTLQAMVCDAALAGECDSIYAAAY